MQNKCMLLLKGNTRFKKIKHHVPVYLATPRNVIPSKMKGSERPLEFAAKIRNLYSTPGSIPSIQKDGTCITNKKKNM